ncbi:MAG TPA: hypothetical protein VKU44_05545 [Terriglobia bacterium]|nr:hypothetical protein [Terriglobia bacterium]
MNVTASSLLGWCLSLLIVAVVVVHAGLIVMTYSTDGTRFRVRFRLDDPLRSAERLLLWFGVQVLALLMAALRAMLAVLSEASAEVGEWFVARRSAETQAGFRSHVL